MNDPTDHALDFDDVEEPEGEVLLIAVPVSSELLADATMSIDDITEYLVFPAREAIKAAVEYHREELATTEGPEVFFPDIEKYIDSTAEDDDRKD